MRASKSIYHQAGDADNFQTVEQALDSAFDLIATLTPPTTSSRDSEFNIIDYGAVGDDATDNTTAIQDTLDAAKANGGGVVIIPKGTFRTGPVSYDTSATSDQLAPRITIRGTNKSSSILKMKTGATGNLLSITGNSGAYQQANFILKDFRLYGQYQSNESGLGITSCVYGAVENVYVSNMGLYGANIFDTDQMHFTGCEFTACNAGMTIGNGSPTTTGPNSLVFTDCHWTNNTGWGMDAYGLNACTFIGGSIQYNGQTLGNVNYWGCKITNNNGAGYGTVNFIGTIFEGNRGQADLWITYAAGAANFITVNITGCSWYRLVIAATNYASTNGILLDGASTALRCNMSGNIFFDGGGYTDNAGRPWISNTNVSSKIYSTGDYFKPCAATSTTLEHPAWSGFTHIPSASGLSFDWGDVALTHSSNLLTLSGGSLTATYNGSATVPTGKFINANNSANLEGARIMGHRGTGAASDRVYFGMTQDNASGSEVFAAKIGSYWQSCAAGTEEGGMFIRLPLAGTERDNYFFGAANFTPGSNGLVALGSPTFNWSTAYLAAGTSVNWDNGDVTATHSANTLTFAGASSGYSFDSTVRVTPSATGAQSIKTTNALSGAITGISSSGAGNHDCIDLYVSSDTAAIDSGAGFANTLGIRHLFGGSSVTGGRQAINTIMNLTSPTNASNPNRNYVGGHFRVIASSGDGGGLGSERGDVFGMNPDCVVQSTATHLGTATCAEFNIRCEAGSSVAHKTMMQLISYSTDIEQGRLTDAIISMCLQNGATGWQDGILIGGQSNHFPITATGTIMRTAGSGTCLDGINISNTTISGYAFKSPNFYVTGDGVTLSVNNGTFATNGVTMNLNGAGSCGFEIGRIDGSSSTPFIDFHSGATAVDYDVRLIASGGTGSAGGGTLSMTGSLAISFAGLPLGATNSTDATSNQVAKFSGTNATRANNDKIYGSYFLANSAGTQKEFARQYVQADVVTNTSEDGSIVWATMAAGTLTSNLWLKKANLQPVSNDGVALGLSGAAFSDLFLASGGVVNWAASDVTLTHSSGALACTGTLTTVSGTATPAAASMAAMVKGGSAGVGIYFGTGDPSATAAKGSLYIKTDATTTTTRLWINTNGSTTWTNFTTAA